MITDLSTDAADLLPLSANTARNWVVSEFMKQRDILAEKLSQSRSRIHFSFDLWTAPAGNRSYLGVVANWVDEEFAIRTCLVTLLPLHDQHTGDNIAECICQVAERYGVGHKVGYCMLDSASNNDTAMTALQPRLVSMFGEDAGVIAPGDRRLRCFSHCLNLAARQLIYGKNLEALES